MLKSQKMPAPQQMSAPKQMQLSAPKIKQIRQQMQVTSQEVEAIKKLLPSQQTPAMPLIAGAKLDTMSSENTNSLDSETLLTPLIKESGLRELSTTLSGSTDVSSSVSESTGLTTNSLFSQRLVPPKEPIDLENSRESTAAKTTTQDIFMGYMTNGAIKKVIPVVANPPTSAGIQKLVIPPGEEDSISNLSDSNGLQWVFTKRS